jgi:hypothetical protein
MNISGQMRRGLARLMAVDSDTGTITRRATADNGRGVLVPSGEPSTHTVECRVSYESGGVWRNGQWEGGSRLDAAPCVFAAPDADIREGDILEWRGRRYTAGPVSRPHLDGGAVALQAKLSEVKNG